MIRKNTIKCKIFSVLFLSLTHVDRLYSKFDRPCCAQKETCPACGAHGCCSEYESYSRTVVDFVSGEVCPRSVWVTRVKCSSCGHTHAILFDPVIPYMRYSLLFILRVLYAHFCQGQSLPGIYASFGICARTFYRWVKIFECHCSEWLGRLRVVECGTVGSLRALLVQDTYADFAADFFCKTNLSFLQSHANPANCRQAPPARAHFSRPSHNTP